LAGRAGKNARTLSDPVSTFPPVSSTTKELFYAHRIAEAGSSEPSRQTTTRSPNLNRPVDMLGQFLLAKTEVPVLASWPKQQIGPWILYWHPRLPLTEIRSQNNALVGWLMGLALDAEGHSLPPVWRLSFDCDAVDAATRFESELNGLGGRFAAVFLTSRSDRFYLDASGSLATVYCEDPQVVASSCNLIAQIGDLQQNLVLIRAFGLPQRDGYFPFRLTPWLGITRLLPNHFLDLRNWTAKRHWPKNRMVDPTRHPEETVRDIAALIEAFISGVTRLGPAQIPITAGYDSRVLLACSRPSLPSIRFITTQIPDVNARLDCAYGRRIAKRFGLDYSVMTWKNASREEIENWLYRTGTCIVDQITRWIGADQRLDPARFMLLGLGGEVGRGHFWLPDDFPARPLSCDELLRRFHFPPVDLVFQEASDWLDQLPTADLLEKLDLFYIEQRLGCWAGPSMYGSLQARFVAYPFNSRRVYEKMLSLPQHYRREGRLHKDLVQLKWPELLEFPFNEPFGLLRLELQARRRLTNLRTAVGNAGARKIKSTLVHSLRSP
jgi:hypothetical protein